MDIPLLINEGVVRRVGFLIRFCYTGLTLSFILCRGSSVVERRPESSGLSAGMRIEQSGEFGEFREENTEPSQSGFVSLEGVETSR